MNVTSPALHARWRPVLICCWVLILITLITGPAVPPASAEDTVTLRLQSAQVHGAGSDARIRLSGTVTNDTAEPVYDLTVAVWRSTQVLRSRSAVTDALTAATAPAGRHLREEAVRVVEDDTAFAPGESRTVTLNATLDDIGIVEDDASYWTGLTATSRPAEGGGTAVVATARTLVTVPSEDDVSIATVVDLSAPPHQIKDNLFLDESLADELSDRLTPLLALAEEDHDWIIDPSTLTEIRDMADGYRVQHADGSVAGEHAEEAAAWLARFDALPTERGWTALFAEPDLSDPAVLPAALALDADDPEGTAPILTLTAPTPDLVAQLTDLDRPVLATGLQTTSPPFEQDGVVVIPAIDPATVTLGAALGNSATSHSAALTALARLDQTQVRLVRTARDAAAAARIPAWVEQPTLQRLTENPAATGTLTPSADLTPPLGGGTGERVTELVEEVGLYADATGVAALATLPDTVQTRAASRWWSDDADGQDAWLAAVDARAGADTLQEAISLDVSPRLSLAGGTSDFPVTVTNDLVDPVTVTLRITEDNPQRIRLIPPDSVTIPAGSSQTVLATAEVYGGGVVQGRIHVETLDGRRLTAPESITVETTSYGQVAWTLIVISGIVLVVSTAVRIRQVRGRHRKVTDG
ncbi:MAG: DUF6049 family protein [Propioniciclava sp.]